jgi:hypothetical protein
MARRPPTRRGLRRREARDAEALARDLEALERTAAGGTPQRPLDVESAAQVDVVATQRPCPRCRVARRLDQHVARTVDGESLRVALISCPRCAARTELWFRLRPSRLH